MFQNLYVGEGSTAYFEDGEYALSVGMTKRLKELINNVGWREGEESWLDYRERTKEERKIEEQKQKRFLQLLVEAFNDVINNANLPIDNAN